MTALLTRLFIRDRDNIQNPTVRAAYGTLVSIVAICLNLILFIGKYCVGLLVGSVAITADAINNLSDAGTAIISLISFRIAAKPADEDHPFGHARIEYFTSMIVSFLILHIGLDLLTDSWQRILHPAKESAFTLVSGIIMVCAILAKLWLAYFNHTIGRKIDSPVMKAAAVDSLSDTVSMAAALISSLVFLFTGFDPDGYIGLLVALLILRSGIMILLQTKDHILGTAPDAECLEALRAEAEACPITYGTHDIVMHNYGPGRTFASLHIEVDGRANIFDIHEQIDDLERSIKEKLGIACTIHMDPIVTDDETVSALRNMTVAAVHTVDERLSIHDFRCVVGHSHTNLIFDLVVPFACGNDEKKFLSAVSAAIQKADPTCFTVITVDRE
ncbi:MAG: cation transporter [Clostridia bacterium]|nr:cation transporter [Clostridia bacterium]